MTVRRLAAMVAALSAFVWTPAALGEDQELHRGEDAIAHLDDRLPEVAAAHRMSAGELADELRETPTLAVNEDDHLIHLDLTGNRAAPDGAQSFSGESSIDPTQVYSLHSDPASNYKLYLDFDGGTYRGSFRSPLISGTRNISPFSGSAEQLGRIWRRAAEDYAPFDIDVTTERPSDADLFGCGDGRCGVYVQVGGTPGQAGFPNGVAGVAAWQNGASLFHSGLEPGAFVFSGVLGGDEALVADVIGHESGHLFGLDHDGGPSNAEYYGGHGSGPTAWSPLMGYGGRSLSHWSSGEYPGANQFEDDTARIASDVGFRADDVVAALPLGGAPAAVEQAGLIERATDTDDFSFDSGAGPAALTVAPAPFGPNLDAQIQLIDGDGAVLATANDPDDLGGTIETTLAAGTYVLRVDGVGDFDPLPGYSDYGSLGQYYISGSYPPGNEPPDCSAVAPSHVTLSPADHKLVQVTLGGATDPDGDPVVLAVGAVTQDEPVDGAGDGDTSPDAAQASTASAVLIRAERSGKGDGRVYRIAYQVSDPAGATCDGSVTVAVRRGNQNATDSGGAFDSFGA